ncbi:MAG: ATPase [Thermoprotei archaeon]|nr:MAG: ATPase [Thermoprotei archaeon]
MEIVVASGKGGTGKTFVAANLAYYMKTSVEPVVAVDADAEAPDLLLTLGGSGEELFEKPVSASRKASIDYNKCTQCLKCLDACRFYALRVIEGKPFVIEEYCEGCNACGIVCPANCISLYVKETGIVRADVSRSGVPVVTADLDVGGRNSGELVFLAKSEAYALSRELKAKHVVVDAAAGIGCPVISSLAGAHVLITVVEPTPPSISGAKRLLEVAEKMRVKPFAVLNKFDMPSSRIDDLTEELGVEVLGKIPYHRSVVEAYVNMKPLLAYAPDGEVSKRLKEIFNYFVESVLR